MDRESPLNSRVAIVMRTKDRPLLLARAVASVLSQRFRDWALYLVNDGGSREGLEQALAPFLPQFGARLRVIHHDVSLGMEAASNRAIEASTSTYLVVHDDDDSWHPDFLSETVAFLDGDEDARYCGVVTWSELVQEQIEGKEIHPVERKPYNNWYHHIDLHRLLGGNMFPPICFLFRRGIIDSAGRFNEDLPVLGDWDFNIRCLLVADIAVLPKTLAYYHQRVDLAPGDIYSNSVHSGLSLHKRVGGEMRNRLLREHLQTNPGDLGQLAAVSRDFVQLGERVNEVETYLAHRSARVVERMNEVEAYLAHNQSVRVIDRLNQVEAYLAHQSARVIDRLNEVEAYLGHRSMLLNDRLSEREAQCRTLAWYLGRGILRIRRLIATLRGRG